LAYTTTDRLCAVILYNINMYNLLLKDKDN